MKQIPFQFEDIHDIGVRAALVEIMLQALKEAMAQFAQETSSPIGNAKPKPESNPPMTSKERSQHAMFRGQKPPDNMGLLLTTKEVAKLLKISQGTVLKLCNEGTMPKPLRIGRSVRFRYEELRAWVNAGCPTQTEWAFSPETQK